MEVELKLEPGRQEPKVVILAGEDSPSLERLRAHLSGLSLGPITVWRGERALPENQIYAVHLRLYELEERLDTTRFVRISNSEIINLDRVTAIDLSLAGTIRMTLEGAVHAYVSRRYVKKIKDTLNLRGGDTT